MCTGIVERTEILGSGKGRDGWFALSHVNVGYDHPYDMAVEHALTLDFVNDAQGPGARVAVELSRESAERLVRAISAALAQGQEFD